MVDTIGKQHDALAAIMRSYEHDIQALSSGSMDDQTGYSDMQKLSDEVGQQVNDTTINVPNRYSTALADIWDAQSSLNESISDLADYLQNGGTADLTRANDELKSAVEKNNDAVVEVIIQAEKDGYRAPTALKSQ